MTLREAKKHMELFESENKHFRKPIYRAIGTDTVEAMQIIKDNSFEFVQSDTPFAPPVKIQTFVAGEAELKRFEADKKTRYIKIIKEVHYYCGVLVDVVYNQNGILIYNNKGQITLSKTIDKSIDFIRNNSQLIRNLLHDTKTV